MSIILKNPAEIAAMKEAGHLAAFALKKIGDAVVPGISTLELDAMAENLLKLHGAIPTFKGYNGFPASICTSVNQQIVHGIPSKDVILQNGDIISIDLGATVNGWVGDNAWTYAVGQVGAKIQSLMDTTKEALFLAIEQAVAGGRLGDIGHAVQSHCEARGFGVVREYVGHGIGRDMHEDPSVPNWGKPRKGAKLKEGMTIAIEPMVNLGTHRTVGPHDSNNGNGGDGWTVETADGLPSAHFEKTIAITADGPVILTEI